MIRFTGSTTFHYYCLIFTHAVLKASSLEDTALGC
jgi:hypothetical protein